MRDQEIGSTQAKKTAKGREGNIKRTPPVSAASAVCQSHAALSACAWAHASVSTARKYDAQSGQIVTATCNSYAHLTRRAARWRPRGKKQVQLLATIIALLLFICGVAIAIWSTERLLRGMLGVAFLLRMSPFAVGAVLSGLEAENIAIGLAAGRRGASAVALGSVYGGAIFLVCVAFGLSLVIAPFPVKFPPSFLLIFASAPVVSGLALWGAVTPRWAGVALLLAFFLCMGVLLRDARGRTLLVSEEIEEAEEDMPRSRWRAIALTLLGIGLLAIGGEMIAGGAEGIIAGFGVPAAIMGMLITPACVELDEVVRELLPALAGRADVSAGNLVGTQLYFVLFNLGLIALFTPTTTPATVRLVDWPFLVLVSCLAAAALWRGWSSKGLGIVLLACYAGYVAVHVVVG